MMYLNIKSWQFSIFIIIIVIIFNILLSFPVALVLFYVGYRGKTWCMSFLSQSISMTNIIGTGAAV